MHSERHSAPRLVHEEFGVGSPSGLSPSALRLVDELKSSRSGPKGLRVERSILIEKTERHAAHSPRKRLAQRERLRCASDFHKYSIFNSQ